MRRYGFVLRRIALLLLFLTSLAWPTTLRAGAAERDPAALFQRFYERNGGVEIFGLALSGTFDLGGRQVQYFERARLEWHPEFGGTENEVLMGALGREAIADRTFPPAGPLLGARYFPQTGHNLGGEFASFWSAHNGARIFGYPLSETLQERNADDNRSYTVQYFERTRMEWHPETGRIVLGRLGAQQYAANFLGIQSAGAALSPYERRVLDILLGARNAGGVASPQLDPALVSIARERSADMATRGYFGHQTPDGATIFTLLNAAGVEWSYAGEIISRNNYANEQTAAVAGNAYLASPAHRAVAVDPQYGAVGVGHSVDRNGMHYYTVVFVRR